MTLDNLLLADPRCNASKRAHLAAMDHVDKWVQRFMAGSTISANLAALAKREA